jgi:hypothetical protein
MEVMVLIMHTGGFTVCLFGALLLTFVSNLLSRAQVPKNRLPLLNLEVVVSLC